jgi:integrase
MRGPGVCGAARVLELRAAGNLVFCQPESGFPPDRSKLIRRFKEAIARADVPPITFHELRHTFGTRMAAAGVPLRTIQH